MIEQVRCPGFVNRAVEVEFLHERSQEASRGRGSLIFVNGEAGVGKSRLIDEVVRRATPFDMRHAVSWCLEHARSPLGPLCDIIRTLHAADDSVLTVARSVRRVLARLVPELEPQAPAADEAQGAISQYAAISEMFRRYGERQPLVLVIEDAHWADVSTLEFLKYFSARVGATAVLLIVVTRSQTANPDHFAPVVAELRRQSAFHALEIEPLGRAEMQTLLRGALGSKRLAHKELRDVSGLADGNPLFAEELLAFALVRTPAPRALPASIRAIFLERISALQPEDRDILIEAAVIGRRFDPIFVARLTKRSPQRVLLALRRARSLQLIVEDVEHTEGVVFRHALVRETLYESILTAEARALHQRIVRELEELPDRAQRMAALAYHAWAGRELEKAVVYNQLAGDEAMAKLATNEAVLFYEHALGSLARADARRLPLLRKLGAAYSASGLSGRAIEVYEEAHADALRSGIFEARADLCFRIGREHAARAEGDAALRWCLAGLDAVESLPDGPFTFAALAHGAMAHCWRGDREAAEHLIERAQRFTGERSPAAVQDLHDAIAHVDLLLGRGDQALARYEQAGYDATAAGSASLAVRVYCNCSTLAAALGELSIAFRIAEEAVRLADEILVPLYRPYALVAAAKFSAHAGRLDLARSRFSAAEDAAAGLDAPRLSGTFVPVGLFLAKHLNDWVIEERYSDGRAIEDAFSSGEPWWIGTIAQSFADYYARAGRLDDARALIHRAFAVLPYIYYSPELAITTAAYGDDADLALARDQLAQWAQRAGDYGLAFRELFDAHGAKRAGQSPAALGSRAARRFEASGASLLAAEAYEVAGERAAAVQIYLRAGSTADVARLEAPATTMGPNAVQFTKREREVMNFVSDGRSNREIANLLSISERTVESHIHAILGKVGGRSRADIIKLPSALRRGGRPR